MDRNKKGEERKIMDELDIVLLTKRSVQGVLALISRNFFLNLISAFSFILISSILQPRDIGIYTAVIAIQRIINFFTDFGLGAALIQKKEELTEGDLKTSFTLQASATLIIFIAVFLLRGSIATYFRLSLQAEILLVVLVFCIFLSSFKTIPSILLERKIKFEKLIIPQMVESFLFNALLIFLVFRGLGIASFSWAFLISALAGIPFYYVVSPWKIGLSIDRGSLHHLKFGARFQAKNILAAIKDDALTVFLAKTLSYTDLGYIGFAQRLAFYLYRYVVDSVTKVTFSTYARIQGDLQVVRKAIEKSLFFVSAGIFPLLTGLIIVSPYLIKYFPGWNNKWEPALLSLIFFCLNAIVSSMSGILVNILDANGKVKITLNLMILWTALTWILTPILMYFFGYNGVAVASFLVTLTIFITISYVRRIVDFHFFRSIHKPFIGTAIMAFVVYFVSLFFITNFISLIAVVVLGGGVYLGCIYFLARDEFRQALYALRLKHEG